MLRKAILLLPAVLIATMAAIPVKIPHGRDLDRYRTEVYLANKTGHSVYVDAITHGGWHPEHFGLVMPDHRVLVKVTTGDLKLFTDIYVYVKAEHSEEASKTICTARKTFGATPAPLHESAHYDGKHCWIAPK